MLWNGLQLLHMDGTPTTTLLYSTIVNQSMSDSDERPSPTNSLSNMSLIYLLVLINVGYNNLHMSLISCWKFPHFGFEIQNSQLNR
jgi:hypothetical protein